MRARTRARYAAKVIDPATRIQEAQLFDLGDPSFKSKHARWLQFCSHCYKNGIRSDYRSHWLSMAGSWASSMLQQGLTPGSVKRYVEMADEVARGAACPIKTLRSALDQMETMREPSHATDLTDQQIVFILRQLYACEKRYAYTVYWMWSSPFRHMDLTNLRREDFFFNPEKGFFKVNVRNTKVAKKKVAGGNYVGQLRFMAIAPAKLVREAIEHVTSGDPQSHPFRSTTDSLNRALAAAKPLLEDCGRPSTYSLRRSFIDRVKTFYTAEDGTIDWESVQKITLHDKKEVPKAFYERRVPEEKAFAELQARATLADADSAESAVLTS